MRRDLAPPLTIRDATPADLEALGSIYNQGIEDRIATLDTEPKSAEDIATWWGEHDDRYAVLVASVDGAIIAWASLNRFSHRCAHSAIADLSIYVERSHRGRGVGSLLMAPLEARARAVGFRKIVLHTHNASGIRLYRKCGFREVGIFAQHGKIGDRYIDVTAMEKLL